jgi:porphobilinogen synthase
MKLVERPRRLRQSVRLRELVHEVDLRLAQLVQPYFLVEGRSQKEPISGFTEVYRWGVDALSTRIERDLEKGVANFLLFGNAVHKDDAGSESYAEKGVVPTALRELRRRFGNKILLFTDVCLCPYTSHGHCGVVEGGEVANDLSMEPLARMALCHAQAGADFVAPSDMMDGRIGFIRQALDDKGFSRVGILAYTAKYASSYYGPFREALASTPQGTDRASYQMDFRSATEALRELRLDVEEGADIVMVKPALPYLDIIARLRAQSDVPVAAYSVSAEYEMVKSLAQKGMADERKMVIENLTAIRRAGAQIIVTYHASELAEKGWLC